jgi:hypothetical protein
MKLRKISITLLIIGILSYILLGNYSFVLSYYDDYFVVTYRLVIIVLTILYISFLLIKLLKRRKSIK